MSKRKVMVYFRNNNKASFDPDKIVLVNQMPSETDLHTVMNRGYAVISWDSICFTRVYEEAEEDD